MKMAKMIVLCCLAVAAFAAPQNGRPGRFPVVAPFDGPGPAIPAVVARNRFPNDINRPLRPNQPYIGYEGRNYNGPYENVRILEQTNEVNPDGSYQYSYVTDDGQQAQAEGLLKDLGDPEGPTGVARGSYSYTAPDGTPISVEWIADELGFRVQGSHIHESIQKALAVNPVIPVEKVAPFPRGPAPFARGPAPFPRGPAPFPRGPAPFGSFLEGVPSRDAKIVNADDDDN